MDRITVRVEPRQNDALEDIVDDGLYPNKSEAVRAAIRQFIHQPGGGQL